MRVVSLIAGITLVVAGIAGLLGRRDQLGAERDRQLATTAELTAAQFDETLARISAVLTVATADTDVDQLGSVLGLPVCAVDANGAICSSLPTVAATGIKDALGAVDGYRLARRGRGRVRRGSGVRRRRRHRSGAAPAARQHDARRLRPANGHERRPRARRRRAAAAGPDGRGRPLRTPRRRSSSSRTGRGPCARRRPRPSGSRPRSAGWSAPSWRSAPCSRSLALGGMLAEHRVAAASGDDRCADRSPEPCRVRATGDRDARPARA